MGRIDRGDTEWWGDGQGLALRFRVHPGGDEAVRLAEALFSELA